MPSRNSTGFSVSSLVHTCNNCLNNNIFKSCPRVIQNANQFLVDSNAVIDDLKPFQKII